MTLAIVANISALSGVAQDHTATAAETNLLSVPARNWAVDCAAREADVIQHPRSFLRYRMHVIDEKGDQVRDQIETPEGSVARLILRNGKPLTHEEDEAERGRLNYLLGTPAAFARHIKSEQANKKMGVDLLKMMPDAMLWSYAEGQPPPSAMAPGDPLPNQQLVVLDFKPNPKWSPPNIPSEALTGLEGRVWIDVQTREMVRLEGKLVKAVNVGWGIVAHLYPGGTASLQQTQVQGDRWLVNHIVEQLVVRALVVKTIHQKLVYDTTDFQSVQSMTYQQAIKVLLDTPLPQ